MTDIQKSLFSMSDGGYKDFQCKLMPTVPPDTVIGVRTPLLRSYGNKIKKEERAVQFLGELPHKYYEENNLHAFLICELRDFDACIAQLDLFLPYVDNWATCDMMRPKSFKGAEDKLIPHIESWLRSDHLYTVRFAVEMLMTFYLDRHFDPKYPKRIAEIKSDEYYLNMMLAWYFATALAKQWDHIIGYLEQARLSVWVHNKAIQKAIESYRITDEQKEYLRTLKIK